MIEKLNEWLTGKFENKFQAFGAPSKYAYIRVTHVPVFDGYFYGEQAYNYQVNKPYRQFVLKPIVVENGFTILNYEIVGKQKFAGVKNLDKLTKDMLRLKLGCDVNLTFEGDAFVGGLTGCDCHVTWSGKETYLQNKIKLTKDSYFVEDLGFDRYKNHQIWGSRYGPFEFKKMPK